MAADYLSIKSLYNSYDDSTDEYEPIDYDGPLNFEQYLPAYNHPDPVYNKLYLAYMDILNNRNIKLVKYILINEFYTKRSKFIERVFYIRVCEIFPKLAESMRNIYKSVFIFHLFTLNDFMLRVKYNGNQADEYMKNYLYYSGRLDIIILLKEKYNIDTCGHDFIVQLMYGAGSDILKGIISKTLQSLIYYSGYVFYTLNVINDKIQYGTWYGDGNRYQIIYTNGKCKDKDIYVFYWWDYPSLDLMFIREIINIIYGREIDELDELSKIEQLEAKKYIKKYNIDYLKKLFRVLKNPFDLENTLNPELLFLASHELQVQFAIKTQSIAFTAGPLVIQRIRDRLNLIYIRNLIQGFDVSEIAKFL